MNPSNTSERAGNIYCTSARRSSRIIDTSVWQLRPSPTGVKYRIPITVIHLLVGDSLCERLFTWCDRLRLWFISRNKWTVCDIVLLLQGPMWIRSCSHLASSWSFWIVPESILMLILVLTLMLTLGVNVAIENNVFLSSVKARVNLNTLTQCKIGPYIESNTTHLLR